MSQDRRQDSMPSTTELHQLSQTDIEDFINKERRSIEKKRLVNVKQQKSLWGWTLAICLIVNLLFFGLAIYGLNQS